MLASYKRYWEPSLPQVLGISLPVGAIATAITQPIEFVKTRIQVRTEGVGLRNKNFEIGVNPFKVFRQIHETGRGLGHFYYGFDAALLSRVGYLFIRNSLYKTIYDKVKPFKPSNDLSNREKAALSGSVGGLAAFLTSPFELAQTRMIVDGGLPQQNRRNYKSCFDALSRIVAEEGGASALFKGAWANVVRMAAVNMALTGPYDYLNEKLWITFGDFGFNETLSIIWAAGWCTLLTLPFDNVKTRAMKQFSDPTKNRLNYANYRDIWKQTFYYEKWTGFYAGGSAYFAKMLLLSVVTVQATNAITKSYKQKAGLQEWQI